ncbi:galactose-1-phosphate uridylyltransferase [Kineosphaera limosa]|uniref:DUF4921 domain-containing protein n=1 Tax=Kineosphaera limosa NBRC 100340 TaxID=1184609 RepID=K6WY28_9MICO|nr:DUF4921 family protein [Kineosphaera limosa]NYE00374.1 galactose-1-phosphate uridylyltransferase [Kineosphaera limosa]GAB97012.1 hypothetical protein KILIM_054_00220 [Kineosphaera limosa NBRC 100340]
MSAPAAGEVDPHLHRLPDGTVKQINPFTGTQVWTVPGRGNRPLTNQAAPHQRLDPARAERHCAFCPERMNETPPERIRRIRTDDGWRDLRNVPAGQLGTTQAEFRVIPNLFEIVSLRYWYENHGYELPEAELARRRAYLADPQGRAHVLGLVGAHRPADLLTAGDEAIVADSIFGGFHDVIVARRHHVDGATCDDELASASTLSADEHEQYVDFTLAGIRDLFAANERIVNVVAFQNWLRPAGASFDHLHKQLVGLDELGRWRSDEVVALRADPDLFTRYGLDFAERNGLVVASAEHAVAFAGFGHRYPTLEVWTRRLDADPWNLTPEELADVSALLHACHAAGGPGVPCNEEWHYRPPSVAQPMPLRVLLKWRISTPAGFEGGSRIYVNTIDPWTLADRARATLATADGLSARVHLA